MKKYFAQLRPLERRLAVGVIVILIVVLNWVFIWPHFSDWGNLRRRDDDARRKMQLYQATIAQTKTYETQVKSLESSGDVVPLEDMAVNMLRTIQTQSAQSGVGLISPGRSIMHTNDAFFVEQVQNISVLGDDKQLVDFLYKLGNDPSMIRVRDLELQPDAAKQHLNANIQLVASYQKKTAAANLKPATAKAK